MVDSNAARDMTEAVTNAKLSLGGSGSGAFLINEFGQVLVPSTAGDGSVLLVGEWSGPVVFENAFAIPGASFDLTDTTSLHLGDVWPMPYIGIPYILAASNLIYIPIGDSDGTTTVELPASATDLIAAVRALRPSGAVRFLVLPGGAVLTKVPVRGQDDGEWQARFVTTLNYSDWYRKEQG